MEDEVEKNITQEDCSYESDIFKKEINEIYETSELQSMMDNNEFLLIKINELNEDSIRKMKGGKFVEAMLLLRQAEKTLEFAASCGKNIDRGVIIIILYNLSCVYQSLWKLEKCSRYIDAVIYNLKESLEENQNSNKEKFKEFISVKLKRMKFLTHSYLQYCAILSQLNKHFDAKNTAFEALKTMNDIFKISYKYVLEMKNKSDFDIKKFAKTTIAHIKNKSINPIPISDPKSKEKNLEFIVNQTLKSDISFKKIIIDYAFPILQELSKTKDHLILSSRPEALLEVKKSLYFWKKNPENNEKHLRNELNAQRDVNLNKRSLLGVKAETNQWIESFNIGSIMHMNPIKYEEFNFAGDFNYEISKNKLLEKVIFESICFFTIATEMRFIEIEKNGLKINNTKEIQTEEYRLSELYHLKAIDIVCKYIKEECPYINHLITSYHKHYNNDLEAIKEESFCSNIKKTDEEEEDTGTKESYTNDSSNKKNSSEKKKTPNLKIDKPDSIKEIINQKNITNKESILMRQSLNIPKEKQIINISNMEKVKSLLQNLQLSNKIKKNENTTSTTRTSNNTKENIIKSNGLIKNKSLSARTHHENDLSSSSYIEKLKRLKVYDELLALKKLPISKLIPFDKDINFKKEDFQNNNKTIKKQQNSNLAIEKIPKLNLEQLLNSKKEESCFYSPREKTLNIRKY